MKKSEGKQSVKLSKSKPLTPAQAACKAAREAMSQETDPIPYDQQSGGRWKPIEAERQGDFG